jgi:hypothetical protein
MDAIDRAERAATILNDTVFQEAVAAVDAQIVEQWRDAERLEDREQAHALQRALQAVIQSLEIFVSRGEYAKRKGNPA